MPGRDATIAATEVKHAILGGHTAHCEHRVNDALRDGHVEAGGGRLAKRGCHHSQGNHPGCKGFHEFQSISPTQSLLLLLNYSPVNQRDIIIHFDIIQTPPMPNLSLRDLDVATLSRIKSAARRQKRSVNRLIVETLQQHYAAGQRPPDGVDALAGTWSKADLAEFTAAIAPFGEIDRALWVAEPKMAYRVKPVKAAGTTGGPARKRPAVDSKTASK